VAVVVHELYLPPRTPWLALLGLLQRRQLHAVLASAHAALTPVPAWLPALWAAGHPDLAVRLAPIGATLPVSPASRAEARAGLGLTDDQMVIGVISPAAGGFLRDWVQRAVDATAGIARVHWLACGFGSEVLGIPRVHPLGALPGPELARVVRALDLAVAPYVDGLTMRRSGAMLALASGVPVVSSTGQLFDFRLSEYTSCEPSADAFAARVALLARSAETRAALGRRSAEAGPVTSPTVLADALLDALAAPRPAA
jgi:hypothetical protein